MTHQDNASRYSARGKLNSKPMTKSSSGPQKRKESGIPPVICNSKDREKEDVSYTIPSIVNGITMESIPVKLLSGYNPVSSCILKDEMKQHINKLNDDISNHIKCDNRYETPHTIVLIAGSHLRGFSSEIKCMLKEGYECVSIVKPGATSKILIESLQETVRKLTQKDLVVLGCGTNDLEFDKFDSVFQNVKKFLSIVSHTNSLFLGIPFGYDLHNSLEVNCKIYQINKKLQKLTRVFPNTSFLETANDSELFTKHGLHQSKLGKKLT